jgi:hypothetical protein
MAPPPNRKTKQKEQLIDIYYKQTCNTIRFATSALVAVDDDDMKIDWIESWIDKVVQQRHSQEQEQELGNTK